MITKTKIAYKIYVHKKLKLNKLTFFKYELIKKKYELYKPTIINHKKYANTVEILIIQDYLLIYLLSKVIY